jgi:hypothetical protein
MEVTQRLQSMQDEACTLFEEIEGQGSQLEQVVATVEQCLEGPVTEQVIQEFVEQEDLVKQQVEEARAKLEAFEAYYPDQSDLGRVTGECWGLVGPQPSFEETLVVFDHFWDFDRLVEDRAPRRSGDHGISPILQGFLGF